MIAHASTPVQRIRAGNFLLKSTQDQAFTSVCGFHIIHGRPLYSLVLVSPEFPWSPIHLPLGPDSSFPPHVTGSRKELDSSLWQLSWGVTDWPLYSRVSENTTQLC